MKASSDNVSKDLPSVTKWTDFHSKYCCVQTGDRCAAHTRIQFVGFILTCASMFVCLFKNVYAPSLSPAGGSDIFFINVILQLRLLKQIDNLLYI